jgi:hypothetical protein
VQVQPACLGLQQCDLWLLVSWQLADSLLAAASQLAAAQAAEVPAEHKPASKQKSSWRLSYSSRQFVQLPGRKSQQQQQQQQQLLLLLHAAAAGAKHSSRVTQPSLTLRYQEQLVEVVAEANWLGVLAGPHAQLRCGSRGTHGWQIHMQL